MKERLFRPKKWMVLAAAAVLITVMIIAPESHSQLPSQVKSDDKVYRDYMMQISRQLGTTCTTCHNPANFASSEKANFKVAKDHIRLTQLLIDNGFDGVNNRPKADCYLCHRGKLQPDYREPFDPLMMQKSKTEKATSSD